MAKPFNGDSLSKRKEIVKDREAMGLQSMGLKRVRHNLATEQQQHGYKNKSMLKFFVGILYTFHRTETKITCYTISHKDSPQVFAHMHVYCLKQVFSVAARPCHPCAWLSSQVCCNL